MKKSIFDKIILKELPADIIYQDKLITAFHDINPQTPVHILVVPNTQIYSMNDIKKSHVKTLGHMLLTCSILAKKLKIDKSGYRIVINCNKDACQKIYHLHIHLLGGRYLGSMSE